MKHKTLVVATRNIGKVREFSLILKGVYEEILSLANFDNIPKIEETGLSFRENALIKAETVSGFLGVDVIGDDSGLVVDALGGAPGIYSARYAGERASDDENNEKLLSELKAEKNRAAKFICCIALVLADGTREFFEGECKGTILREKRGSGGFGYDPVFYVSQYAKTMAEIDPSIKNRISHRAIASGKLKSYFSTLK
ncbi:MAG: XTP/dITP diphosphatase [Candidatus Dadabacteria bacterium]|nr:XTP/dITP diphosphatase [Candidatus Dadabacteria bacterium]